MEFKRLLQLKKLTEKKSIFLLGARSSGKSYLVNHSLRPERSYDLNDTKIFRRLQLEPSLIFDEILENNELIFIDEVQKIPEILDEVHRAIEKKKARFILSGSSARKLKSTHANLLGGRASRIDLLPLTTQEIPNFDLLKFLKHGGLPRHYLTDEIEQELEDYTSLYLTEEIKNEAITRNLDSFSRFLEIMAIHSGDELAISNFASDCQIKASTFKNYIEVLKDTLIGFEVPPYLATKKRKAITRSKFFLFDVGITNYLAHRESISYKSELFGKSLEHFIAMELRAYLSYNKIRQPLCYWRSTSQFEVDFLVGEKLAIEVKATDHVHEKHLKGLRAFSEEKKQHKLIVISLDPHIRKFGNIETLPWDVFLNNLWAGKYL